VGVCGGGRGGRELDGGGVDGEDGCGECNGWTAEWGGSEGGGEVRHGAGAGASASGAAQIRPAEEPLEEALAGR